MIDWLNLIKNWDKLLDKGVISLNDLIKFSKDNNFIILCGTTDLEKVFNTFDCLIESERRGR